MTEDTNKFIVRGTVRSAEHTERPNLTLSPQDAEKGEILQDINMERLPEDITSQHLFPLVGAGDTQFLDTERLVDLQLGENSGTEEIKEEDLELDMPSTDDETKTKLYNDVINMINKGIIDDEDRWEFEGIIGHRTNPKNPKLIDLKIQWTGYTEPTWEPLIIIWEDDPASVRVYAKKQKLLNHPAWKFILKEPEQKSAILFTTRACAAKRKKNTPKYKFGQRVPRMIEECHLFDEQNLTRNGL